MANRITIREWINPLYLSSQTLQEVNTAFNHAQPFPFIQLGNFFLEQQAEKIMTAALKAKKNQEYIPHMHSYCNVTLDKDKELKQCSEFLKSTGFLSLLGTMIKQQCKKAEVEMCIFNHGNYTLLHDTALQKHGIFCFIDLTKNWPAEANGQTVFVNETGAEPVIFRRAWNTLNIVQLNSNTHSFLKYVNAASGKKSIILITFHFR